jgi:hypothetical protein
MTKDTTKTTEMPELVQALLVLLKAHARTYEQKRTFRRVVSLVIGELFAFGRRTVSQGLLALGLGEQDWSAWYRLFSLGRFDEEKAGQVMLRESVQHVGGASRTWWGRMGCGSCAAARRCQGRVGCLG